MSTARPAQARNASSCMTDLTVPHMPRHCCWYTREAHVGLEQPLMEQRPTVPTGTSRRRSISPNSLAFRPQRRAAAATSPPPYQPAPLPRSRRQGPAPPAAIALRKRRARPAWPPLSAALRQVRCRTRLVGPTQHRDRDSRLACAGAGAARVLGGLCLSQHRDRDSDVNPVGGRHSGSGQSLSCAGGRACGGPGCAASASASTAASGAEPVSAAAAAVLRRALPGE